MESSAALKEKAMLFPLIVPNRAPQKITGPSGTAQPGRRVITADFFGASSVASALGIRSDATLAKLVITGLSSQRGQGLLDIRQLHFAPVGRRQRRRRPSRGEPQRSS